MCTLSAGYNNKARAFLSRGAQAIIRMRGLPFSCTAQQVVEFFAGKCEILDGEEGILFVKNCDEKPTGDAFVLFASDEYAQRALQKHRQNIGSRYVELFRSTISELQQVLSISMDNAAPSAGASSSQQAPAKDSTSPQLAAAGVRAQRQAPVARVSGATYAQVATTCSRAGDEPAAGKQPAQLPEGEQAKRDGSDSSAFDSNSLQSSGSSELAQAAADQSSSAQLSPSSTNAQSPSSTLSMASSASSTGHRSWQNRNQRTHNYRAAHNPHYTPLGAYNPQPFHYASQRQHHHQQHQHHQHQQQQQHYQPMHFGYQQQAAYPHGQAPAAGPQLPAHVAYAPHPYHFYPQMSPHAAYPPPPPPNVHEQSAASKRDCVRLRGLPFEAQVEDVLYFLADHSKSIAFQGVHMVYSAQGQPSGEAIIQMNSCAAASSVAQEFHRKVMSVGKKQRYIEVIPCSIDDMNLMLGLCYLPGRSILPASQNPHQALAATNYPQPAYPHHLQHAAVPEQKAHRNHVVEAKPQPLDPSATEVAAATVAETSSDNGIAGEELQEKPAREGHKMMQNVQPANMMQPPATYYPILYYYPQQMLAAPYH